MLEIRDARIQSGSYGQRSQPVDTLVLHYTALDLEASLRVLRHRGVSAHYVLAEDGVAYKLLENHEVAWHAGVSMWRGRRNVNARSIGIEIVNLDGNSHDYPPAQVAALVELCHHVLAQNPGIRPRDIVGHSDVAPRRKVDPGSRFPWQALAAQGVGLWPAEPAMPQDASEAERQALLQACGYAHPHGYGTRGDSFVFVDDPDSPPPGVSRVVRVATRDILRAFQQHYLPATASGEPTPATIGVLRALAAMQ
jgi:N-acetyl-anhydromuramyl-L-alanine amidase AmpD